MLIKDLKAYMVIEELINYSEQYILSSFPKTESSIKIKFTDNLYLLLENVIRANVNTGRIRNKYQRELLVNINYLDYFIEVIKKKEIISGKRYISFIKKLCLLKKLVNGWLNSEENREYI